ncbi:MAG: hypothetical protein AB1511_12780 [Deinococcota bacterium]
MTRQGAPTPPPSHPNDAEYVRRLALAILGTLQSKGLLTADEVDTILIAARRAAQGQPVPENRPAPRPMQITVQPSPPPGTLSWHVSKPPAAEDQAAGEKRPEDAPSQPPVIDIKLD